MNALFRVFFPSWKFFDNPEKIASLFYRIHAESPSSWTQIDFKTKLNFKNLFLNAEGCLRLAEQSVVDRAVHESQDYLERPSDFFETVTYGQLVRIVQSRIAVPAKFEFKISMQEDVFVSGLHTC